MKIQSPDDVFMSVASLILRVWPRWTGLSPLALIAYPLPFDLAFGSLASFIFFIETRDPAFAMVTGAYLAFMGWYWSMSSDMMGDCRKHWNAELFKKYLAMALARREATQNHRLLNLLVTAAFIVIFTSRFMADALGLSVWECLVFLAVGLLQTFRLYCLCCDPPLPDDGDVYLIRQGV